MSVKVFEIIAFVAILGFTIFMFLFAINYRNNPDVKLAVVEGDEDVKIAGGQFGVPKEEREDIADEAAQEFLRQKHAGNIEVAGELGNLLAELLWADAQELIMKDEGDDAEREVHQQILLKCYAVNAFIAENSPNQLLAETALSVFYSKIEELSKVLFRHVKDIASFSLYILNQRTENTEIGRIYARLSEAEDNPQVIKEGNEIYHNFYDRCEEIVQKEIEFNL